MTIDNQIHENIIHLKKINATFPFSQKLIELDNRYLIPIIVDNKIGFINKTFEIIFEPQFENVRGNFNTSQDIVCALKEGKWGVINTNETLISFQYSYITQGIGCMLFTVGKNYKHAVLDGYENIVIDFGQYDWIGGFEKGLARVRLKKKWGIIDGNNNIVLPIEYDEIWNFYG